MAQGTVIPNVPPQFFANDGTVAAGYKLFSYSAGTTTKINTYTDSALTTSNTNPIVLDSAGRATIFLSATSYKFVLAPPTDTDPPTSPIWTRDNVLSLAAFNVNVDVQGTAGDNLAANDCVYLSAGDGGNTAGRWYKTDPSVTYASLSAHSIGFVVTAITLGATGAIRIIGRLEGFSGRTAGALQYVGASGVITQTKDPNAARAVAQADTTTSIVISEWLPQSLARINVFTTLGASTWTRHPDASSVTVVCVGGGGGGGSGRRGAAGSDRYGGGGGAGGNYTSAVLNASLLGVTETVTVATGGTGGTGIAADNTNGNNGTNGGTTTFGAWVQAGGGGFGGGGTAAAGPVGAPNTAGQAIGGQGGAGINGLGLSGSVTVYLGCGAGGGGGGINAANTAGNGGPGSAGSPARGTPLNGGTGGVVAGADATVGTPAVTGEASGGGGGGGGAGTSGTFNAGKVGGIYGGGGGGGGGVLNGTAGSAGGAGGNGVCIVVQV